MSIALSSSAMKGGHSAAVSIELYVDGRVLSPSHAACDYLLFRQPQTVRPGLARLVITIDGVAQESTLRILPQHARGERIPVEIVKEEALKGV